MKNLKYFVVGFLSMFICLTGVNAASGSITARSSSSTVVVGSTFTVTVTVSCSEALGSWQFGIAYDSSNISLQSGDTNIAAYGDGSARTKTYTYKFKAIKSGSASVRVTGASMVSWNDVGTLFTPSVSNASVSVKTQKEIEASYSKDNNLKSLSIDGYDISPAFNKDTLEYSVSVPDTVEEINISAKVNDSRASVRGTGNVSISAGMNKIEVVVTAQNGSTKTYVINVEVKDLNPIEVDVDGVKYTIVKKDSLLTSPTGFTPLTVKINDIDIPAFKSDLTKFTVVGLKDESGNVSMFIYDADNNKYTKYTEIKASALTLYPTSTESIPENFTKTKITINGVEFDAYESELSKDLVLVYAMNVEDGNTGYYIYDKEENSFIRYNADFFDVVQNQNKEYKLYLIALTCVATILLLISILQSRKNTKMKKLIMRASSARVESRVDAEPKAIETPEKEVAKVTEEEKKDDEEDDDNIIDLDEKPKKSKKKKKK